MERFNISVHLMLPQCLQKSGIFSYSTQTITSSFVILFWEASCINPSSNLKMMNSLNTMSFFLYLKNQNLYFVLSGIYGQVINLRNSTLKTGH